MEIRKFLQVTRSFKAKTWNFTKSIWLPNWLLFLIYHAAFGKRISYIAMQTVNMVLLFSKVFILSLEKNKICLMLLGQSIIEIFLSLKVWTGEIKETTGIMYIITQVLNLSLHKISGGLRSLTVKGVSNIIITPDSG